MVEVRLALPGNVAFYRRLGYVPFAEHAHAGHDHPTCLELRKPLELLQAPWLTPGRTRHKVGAARC